MNRLQLTFAMIKPNIVKNPIALQNIHQLILENNFSIVHNEPVLIKNEIAEKLYGEHKSKFFYNRLITFMASGHSEALILAKVNAISAWRNILGPTKVYHAVYSHPDSLRGLYGLSDTRNGVHGSDSDDSVAKEIGIVFPKFSINDWYEKQEPYFRNNQIVFLKERYLHQMINT